MGRLSANYTFELKPLRVICSLGVSLLIAMQTAQCQIFDGNKQARLPPPPPLQTSGMLTPAENQSRLNGPAFNMPFQGNQRRNPVDSPETDAANSDASLRRIDKFVDHPQIDEDGVRHFNNGKYFDLSKVTMQEAVDSTNASQLAVKRVAPQQNLFAPNDFNGPNRAQMRARNWAVQNSRLPMMNPNHFR